MSPNALLEASLRRSGWFLTSSVNSNVQECTLQLFSVMITATATVTATAALHEQASETGESQPTTIVTDAPGARACLLQGAECRKLSCAARSPTKGSSAWPQRLARTGGCGPGLADSSGLDAMAGKKWRFSPQLPGRD